MQRHLAVCRKVQRHNHDVLTLPSSRHLLAYTFFPAFAFPQPPLSDVPSFFTSFPLLHPATTLLVLSSCHLESTWIASHIAPWLPSSVALLSLGRPGYLVSTPCQRIGEEMERYDAALRQLHLPHVYVLAQGYAGIPALNYALWRPEKVKGLILVDGIAQPSQAPSRCGLWRRIYYGLDFFSNLASYQTARRILPTLRPLSALLAYGSRRRQGWRMDILRHRTLQPLALERLHMPLLCLYGKKLQEHSEYVLQGASSLWRREQELDTNWELFEPLEELDRRWQQAGPLVGATINEWMNLKVD